MTRSFVVGDSPGDIEMGRRAGCRTVLVLTGAGEHSLPHCTGIAAPEFVAGDVAEAVAWILEALAATAE